MKIDYSEYYVKIADDIVNWDDSDCYLYTDQKLYRYNGTRYVEFQELDQIILSHLWDYGYQPSETIVDNVGMIIKSMVWKDKNEYGDMPFWNKNIKLYHAEMRISHKSEDCPFSDCKKVIAFRNGLLDMITGTLRNHNPNYCNNISLSINYPVVSHEFKRYIDLGIPVVARELQTSIEIVQKLVDTGALEISKHGVQSDHLLMLAGIADNKYQHQ